MSELKFSENKLYVQREDGSIISSDKLSPQEVDEQVQKMIFENFELIIETLKYYLDLTEEQYIIIGLWILGTYMHKSFNSFPLLFINAPKGSGKSKTIELITKLSYNGKMINNVSESVLFRTPSDTTLGIDEAENLISKDKNTLRELINSSYKNGVLVERTKKIKKDGQETYVIEKFELYKPIVMGNISGIEEVTGDRCITLILEKSFRKDIVLLMSDFDEDENILQIRKAFKEMFYLKNQQWSLCSGVMSKKQIYKKWNSYIKYIYIQTLLTPLTSQEKELFDKILALNILGRDLELIFPLILITLQTPLNLDKILQILKNLVELRKKEEHTHNNDVILTEFVSKLENRNFIPVKTILEMFKTYYTQADVLTDENWLNAHWIGNHLNALKLVKDKRRYGGRVQLMLDIDKAKKKIEGYK